MSRDTITSLAEITLAIFLTWMAYNFVVFVQIARGRDCEYIPFLHFPIKFIQYLVG